MSSTSGVLYIHSAHHTLRRHVEWAIAAVFGAQTQLEWSDQPAEPGTIRAELLWSGPSGTAAKLAVALKDWQRLRFEVTELSTHATESCRYSYTPTLGIFHAVTGLHGDIMVGEDRIKAVLNTPGVDCVAAMHGLLGTAWDDELECFRYAGDGTHVRWLHEVV